MIAITRQKSRLRLIRFGSVAAILLASPLLTGPALADEVMAAVTPPCDAMSMQSVPAQQWLNDNRWRYATGSRGDDAAQAAYQTLVVGKSPWPVWYAQGYRILEPGTRFQMALAPGQSEQSPGGWGTFNYIQNERDVRLYLAVTDEFKPEIGSIVTYEVAEGLPVLVGSVGPQIDPIACEYLPGGWSQFQLLVPYDQRARYLTVVETRKLP